MGWASTYIEILKTKGEVSFRPSGHSMSPHIKSRQLVTVQAVTADTELKKNDIVLCKVQGHEYLHFIYGVHGKDYAIGNARGHSNGFTSRDKIYGKVIKVEC